MNRRQLEILLKMRDEMSGVMRRASRQMQTDMTTLQRAAGQLGNAFRSLGRMITSEFSQGAIRALALVGAAAIKLNLDFNKALTPITTLVGIAREEVRGWRQDILDLGAATAKAPRELAQAMFVVTSAGARGATALNILKSAAQSSAVGLGQVEAVARALVSAVTAYGEAVLPAARATDILVATVRAGNLAADDLAKRLGVVLPLASQLKISFEEVGAFIATFTRLGVPVSEAATALRGLMSSIIKPSQDARKAYQELGLSMVELRRRIKDDGLQSTLAMLMQLTEGNADTLARLIPEVEALSGALGTAGAQGETYRKIVDEIRKSTGMAGDAFRQTAKEDWFRLEAAMMGARIRLQEFGEKLTPVLEKFLQLPTPIQDTVFALAALQVMATLNLVPSMGTVASVLGTLAMKSFPMLTAATVASAKIVIPVATAMWTALTGPVALAIAAIGAISFAIYKFRDEIVEALTSVKNWLEANWKDIGRLIVIAITGPLGLIATNAFGARDALVEALTDAINFLRGMGGEAFNAAKSFGRSIIEGITDGLGLLVDKVAGVGKAAANAVIDSINAGIMAVNNMIPNRIDMPSPVPDIRLPSNLIPTIPRFERGTDRFSGGWAMVGERGPEMVNMPSGSSVIKAQDIRDLTDALRSLRESQVRGERERDLTETLRTTNDLFRNWTVESKKVEAVAAETTTAVAVGATMQELQPVLSSTLREAVGPSRASAPTSVILQAGGAGSSGAGSVSRYVDYPAPVGATTPEADDVGGGFLSGVPWEMMAGMGGGMFLTGALGRALRGRRQRATQVVQGGGDLASRRIDLTHTAMPNRWLADVVDGMRVSSPFQLPNMGSAQVEGGPEVVRKFNERAKGVIRDMYPGSMISDVLAKMDIPFTGTIDYSGFPRYAPARRANVYSLDRTAGLEGENQQRALYAHEGSMYGNTPLDRLVLNQTAAERFIREMHDLHGVPAGHQGLPSLSVGDLDRARGFYYPAGNQIAVDRYAATPMVVAHEYGHSLPERYTGERHDDSAGHHAAFARNALGLYVPAFGLTPSEAEYIKRDMSASGVSYGQSSFEAMLHNTPYRNRTIDLWTPLGSRSLPKDERFNLYADRLMDDMGPDVAPILSMISRAHYGHKASKSDLLLLRDIIGDSTEWGDVSSQRLGHTKLEARWLTDDLPSLGAMMLDEFPDSMITDLRPRFEQGINRSGYPLLSARDAQRRGRIRPSTVSIDARGNLDEIHGGVARNVYSLEARAYGASPVDNLRLSRYSSNNLIDFLAEEYGVARPGLEFVPGYHDPTGGYNPDVTHRGNRGFWTPNYIGMEDEGFPAGTIRVPEGVTLKTLMHEFGHSYASQNFGDIIKDGHGLEFSAASRKIYEDVLNLTGREKEWYRREASRFGVPVGQDAPEMMMFNKALRDSFVTKGNARYGDWRVAASELWSPKVAGILDRIHGGGRPRQSEVDHLRTANMDKWVEQFDVASERLGRTKLEARWLTSDLPSLASMMLDEFPDSLVSDVRPTFQEGISTTGWTPQTIDKYYEEGVVDPRVLVDPRTGKLYPAQHDNNVYSLEGRLFGASPIDNLRLTRSGAEGFVDALSSAFGVNRPPLKWVGGQDSISKTARAMWVPSQQKGDRLSSPTGEIHVPDAPTLKMIAHEFGHSYTGQHGGPGEYHRAGFSVPMLDIYQKSFGLTGEEREGYTREASRFGVQVGQTLPEILMLNNYARDDFIKHLYGDPWVEHTSGLWGPKVSEILDRVHRTGDFSDADLETIRSKGWAEHFDVASKRIGMRDFDSDSWSPHGGTAALDEIRGRMRDLFPDSILSDVNPSFLPHEQADYWPWLNPKTQDTGQYKIASKFQWDYDRRLPAHRRPQSLRLDDFQTDDGRRTYAHEGRMFGATPLDRLTPTKRSTMRLLREVSDAAGIEMPKVRWMDPGKMAFGTKAFWSPTPAERRRGYGSQVGTLNFQEGNTSLVTALHELGHSAAYQKRTSLGGAGHGRGFNQEAMALYQAAFGLTDSEMEYYRRWASRGGVNIGQPLAEGLLLNEKSFRAFHREKNYPGQAGPFLYGSYGMDRIANTFFSPEIADIYRRVHMEGGRVRQDDLDIIRSTYPDQPSERLLRADQQALEGRPVFGGEHYRRIMHGGASGLLAFPEARNWAILSGFSKAAGGDQTVTAQLARHMQLVEYMERMQHEKGITTFNKEQVGMYFDDPELSMLVGGAPHMSPREWEAEMKRIGMLFGQESVMTPTGMEYSASPFGYPYTNEGIPIPKLIPHDVYDDDGNIVLDASGKPKKQWVGSLLGQNVPYQFDLDWGGRPFWDKEPKTMGLLGGYARTASAEELRRIGLVPLPEMDASYFYGDQDKKDEGRRLLDRLRWGTKNRYFWKDEENYLTSDVLGRPADQASERLGDIASMRARLPVDESGRWAGAWDVFYHAADKRYDPSTPLMPHTMLLGEYGADMIGRGMEGDFFQKKLNEALAQSGDYSDENMRLIAQDIVRQHGYDPGLLSMMPRASQMFDWKDRSVGDRFGFHFGYLDQNPRGVGDWWSWTETSYGGGYGSYPVVEGDTGMGRIVPLTPDLMPIGGDLWGSGYPHFEFNDMASPGLRGEAPPGSLLRVAPSGVSESREHFWIGREKDRLARLTKIVGRPSEQMLVDDSEITRDDDDFLSQRLVQRPSGLVIPEGVDATKELTKTMGETNSIMEQVEKDIRYTGGFTPEAFIAPDQLLEMGIDPRVRRGGEGDFQKQNFYAWEQSYYAEEKDRRQIDIKSAQIIADKIAEEFGDVAPTVKKLTDDIEISPAMRKSLEEGTLNAFYRASEHAIYVPGGVIDVPTAVHETVHGIGHRRGIDDHGPEFAGLRAQAAALMKGGTSEAGLAEQRLAETTMAMYGVSTGQPDAMVAQFNPYNAQHWAMMDRQQQLLNMPMSAMRGRGSMRMASAGRFGQGVAMRGMMFGTPMAAELGGSMLTGNWMYGMGLGILGESVMDTAIDEGYLQRGFGAVGRGARAVAAPPRAAYQAAASGIAQVSASLGRLAPLASGAASGLGAAVPALGGFAAKLGSLAMAGGPITLAIAAAVALGVAVYHFRDDIVGALSSAWEAIKGGVSAAVNAVKSGFNWIVRGITSAINYVIDAVNSLPFVNIGKVDVPGAAAGGVVTGPTFLQAGEGGEPEAILPLSYLRGMLGPSLTDPVTFGGQSFEERMIKVAEQEVATMEDLIDAVESGATPAIKELSGSFSEFDYAWLTHVAPDLAAVSKAMMVLDKYGFDRTGGGGGGGGGASVDVAALQERQAGALKAGAFSAEQARKRLEYYRGVGVADYVGMAEAGLGADVVAGQIADTGLGWAARLDKNARDTRARAAANSEVMIDAMMGVMPGEMERQSVLQRQASGLNRARFNVSRELERLKIEDPVAYRARLRTLHDATEGGMPTWMDREATVAQISGPGDRDRWSFFEDKAATGVGREIGSWIDWGVRGLIDLRKSFAGRGGDALAGMFRGGAPGHLAPGERGLMAPTHGGFVDPSLLDSAGRDRYESARYFVTGGRIRAGRDTQVPVGWPAAGGSSGLAADLDADIRKLEKSLDKKIQPSLDDLTWAVVDAAATERTMKLEGGVETKIILQDVDTATPPQGALDQERYKATVSHVRTKLNEWLNQQEITFEDYINAGLAGLGSLVPPNIDWQGDGDADGDEQEDGEGQYDAVLSEMEVLRQKFRDYYNMNEAELYRALLAMFGKFALDIEAWQTLAGEAENVPGATPGGGGAGGPAEVEQIMMAMGIHTSGPIMQPDIGGVVSGLDSYFTSNMQTIEAFGQAAVDKFNSEISSWQSVVFSLEGQLQALRSEAAERQREADALEKAKSAAEAAPFAPHPGAPGTIPGFAAGGIVTAPTFAMIGEAGPEAVIPLKDFSGAGQPQIVEIHNTIELDGEVVGQSIVREAVMGSGHSFNQ